MVVVRKYFSLRLAFFPYRLIIIYIFLSFSFLNLISNWILTVCLFYCTNSTFWCRCRNPQSTCLDSTTIIDQKGIPFFQLFARFLSLSFSTAVHALLLLRVFAAGVMTTLSSSSSSVVCGRDGSWQSVGCQNSNNSSWLLYDGSLLWQ